MENCANASTPGKPFELPGATEHYAPDRAVRSEHIRIEVDLDFEAKRITGACSTHLVAIRAVDAVDFDAVDLDVESVEVDGKRAEFENTGEKLRVRLPTRLAPEGKAKVAIRYRAKPQKGLYFWGPDQGYPDRPLQAWTQGQDEDSRAWFPCLDSPAQRATTEVIASFPAEMIALSNGVCLADEVTGKRRRMHYQLNLPHPPYLVTLAVGEFEVATAQAGETSLRYLFPKGRQADAMRCVGRTPQMVELFEEITGQAYPFGSYAQVFVTDFIFGGMENTTATTLTDVVLHDERAHLDYSAESLISHELMHQWFGDLLTCREWPQGWLNEGFATYGEVLWKERAEGRDEADQYRRQEMESYLAEARESYARPIVARKFHQPVELFDRHLYEKGGMVLHELRRRLTDEMFFKGIRHYVEKNVGRSVETVDLARAFEEATGHNLDRFFDQYVYASGHPELKVQVRHDAEEKRLAIKVKQGTATAYHLPLEVAVVRGGKESRETFAVRDPEHVFYLPADSLPAQVRIDPRREALCTLEVDKPLSLWIEELEGAPEARARTEAAGALGKDGSNRAVDALGSALRTDEFWATRSACARALAAVRSPDAKRHLLDEGLKVKHPKARRAVVAALGEFRKDAEVGKALRAVCDKGDPSYFVEAEAARSLGKLRLPDTLPVLQRVAEKTSFQDVVAVGAIDGMAETMLPEAYPLVEAKLAYGQPPFIRRAAAVALGKLAEPAQKKREAVETLGDLLRDVQFRVQMAAFDGARALGDRRLLGALESTPFRDGRAVRAAKETARALREGEPQAKEVASLREELDKLKEETRTLKERVDGLGEKKKPSAKKPAKKAGRKR